MPGHRVLLGCCQRPDSCGRGWLTQENNTIFIRTGRETWGFSFVSEDSGLTGLVPRTAFDHADEKLLSLAEELQGVPAIPLTGEEEARSVSLAATGTEG